MREVVAAGLRLNILGKLTRERYQRMAGNIATFGFAESAILDGLENLSLRSQATFFDSRMSRSIAAESVGSSLC